MKHTPFSQLNEGPPPERLPSDRYFYGVLVLVTAAVVLHAWLASGLLESSCMDGVMQSFNPLRRLAAGQTMGREFDVFHGPGSLGLQYIVWWIFGKGLRGVIFARELLAPLLFLLSFALFAKTVRFPWPSAVMLLLTGAYFCGRFGRSLEMGPGVSLLSIRVFMGVTAFFWAALLAPKVRDRRGAMAFAALAGIAEGVAFFFSFEQGLAGAAAGGVTLALWPENPRFRLRGRLLALGLYTASLIVTAGALYGAACGSASWHVVDFFLHDIPQDQFWYFGAPPNTELRSVLFSFLSGTALLASLLLASGGILLLILRQRGWCARWPAWAFTSMLYLCLYAVISQAPTLSFPAHYSSTMLRAAVMVWLCLAAAAWEAREECKSPWSERLMHFALSLGKSRYLRAGALLLLAAIVTVDSLRMVPSFHRMRGDDGSDEEFAGVKLSPAWMEEMAFCREMEAAHPRFAATYSGLIEARLNIFNPASDYIIHSLGRKRGAYVPALQSYAPDVFSTVNPQFAIYESWLEVSHWDLYRWLLRDYEVARITSMRVFWKGRATGSPGLAPPAALRPWKTTGDRFEITPPQDAELHLYEVKVRYRIENPLSALPVLGRVPRYLLIRENLLGPEHGNEVLFAVSLPPHLHEWVFPALIRGGAPAGVRSLATQTFGSPARAVLEGVETREFPLPASALPALGIPW